MTITRILFTGDAFRTSAGEPIQLGVVEWLERVLGPNLRAVTGLPSEVALPLCAPDIPSFVALQGGEPSLDNWTRVFWQKPSEQLVATLAEACAGALVIAIEMPPVLEMALDQAGIPWIDMSIGPFRFLPDWAFHIRTSHHFNVQASPDGLLKSSEVFDAVRHVERWYGSADIIEPTLVFFAQTSKDRTLIRDGGFCGVIEALRGLENLRGSMRLLIKPHPWEPGNPVVSALVDSGGCIADAPTYALLANPHVHAVTLSSSVGREARAFGRQSTVLSPSVQDWAYSGEEVMTSWVSPAWWASILQPAGIPTFPTSEQAWRPNMLRETIGGQGLDLAVWG